MIYLSTKKEVKKTGYNLFSNNAKKEKGTYMKINCA